MQTKNRTGLAVAVSGAFLLLSGTAHAQALGVFCCPPPMKWCSERAPCIKFKCVCPRPVCNPCSLQHYGYYATCWQPWPFPADWSHCPTPPPGAMLPAPAYPPYTPRAPQEQRQDDKKQDEDLTPPRKMTDGPQVHNFDKPSSAEIMEVTPVTAVNAESHPGVRFIR